MNGARDLEGVHGIINAFDLECARLRDRPDFGQTMGCCGGIWGGRSCSWWFSTAYGYKKGGQMGVNRSRDLEGVHGIINAFDLECARLRDRPDFGQTMGCCGGIWGGRSCSWCFSIAFGYGKGGHM